jgi:hypothetical protein
MQAAAKRKEAEIDSKVANAFEFFTTVLLLRHDLIEIIFATMNYFSLNNTIG